MFQALACGGGPDWADPARAAPTPGASPAVMQAPRRGRCPRCRPPWRVTRSPTRGTDAPSGTCSRVTPSTSGPWWAARPDTSSDAVLVARPPRPAPATLLADPLLGALAVELLDQRADVLDPLGDDVLGQLARRRSRPRCRPRRSSRTPPPRRGGPRRGTPRARRRRASVSPGKPTMTLDRMPASGARVAHAVEQVEERLARPEPAHPAQQRLAGVLEGDVEVRHDPGRGGHHVEQAGPDLGRLQVGHPHPLDAPARPPARAASCRAAAGRPGPCRTTWSSR